MIPERTKPEHSRMGHWLGLTLFSFAAGSPASAQRVCVVRSSMTPRAWEAALCLSGVMSPMFFTGTLAGWLGSRRDGWVLLGIHWLGAVIAAVLWYVFARGEEAHVPLQEASVRSATLPQAIADSARALLCVCGAMMVFSVAARVMQCLLEWMIPGWVRGHADALAVMWAVMEIGGGASAVAGTLESPHAALAALCGFGGLSIWLQNQLFLSQNIRPAKLLAMRAVHGAVSYILVRLIKPF